MTEVTTGLRGVLAHPLVYELWSRAVGGPRCRRLLVGEYVRPGNSDRILDLGCGPGRVVECLPPTVEYVGVDLNPHYIASARARFGNGRRDFRVGDAAVPDPDLHGFDIVLVFAVLHHLDDAGALSLFREAAGRLVPDGRIVTVDAVFTADQSAASRAVIACDRGRNVRTVEEYTALAAESFTEVVTTVRSDLLRIPYAHCILEGRVPRTFPRGSSG